MTTEDDFDGFAVEQGVVTFEDWEKEEQAMKEENAPSPAPPSEDEAPNSMRAAPTLADLYGPEAFDGDLARPLVRLDELPHGWGVGRTLNSLLGGGVGPGFFLAVGASSAGGGKSAWTLQLADALAARTAAVIAEGKKEPLTPVLVLSEMTPRVMTHRSLARFIDEDARILRAGKMAPSIIERKDGTRVSEEETERVLRKAREALSSGPFVDLRRHMRVWTDGFQRGAALMGGVSRVLNAWRAELSKQTGCEVWPVVVLDPLQRWADAKRNEIEGQNELVEHVGQSARDGGWIVLATSDTNASSARGLHREGNRQESAAATLRGSYQLIHEADAALVLQRKDEDIAAFIFKNRNGSHLPDPTAGALYRFAPTRMRVKAWADSDLHMDERYELEHFHERKDGDPIIEVTSIFKNDKEKKERQQKKSEGDLLKEEGM